MLLNRDRASAVMRRHKLDALIACTIENVFYTSSLSWTPWSIGRKGEWNFLFTIIGCERNIEPCLIAPIIVDVWPEVQTTQQTWIRDIRYYGENWYDIVSRKLNTLEKSFLEKMKTSHDGDPFVTLGKALKQKGITSGRIGIERNALNFSGESREMARLQSIMPDVDFVEAGPIFREIRVIKTDEEIERLKQAIVVNENALKVAFGSLRDGNEIDNSRAAARKIAERGALPLSVGIRASRKPNGKLGYRFKEGDVVWHDFLISYNGYCADTSRMAAVGEPRNSAKQTCRLLTNVTGSIIELARPGTRVGELYEEAIGQLTEKSRYAHGKLGPCLGHGIGICLGNCLGICPHEEPWVVPGSDGVLKPGMVINLEFPLNYLGLGVFNVEDTILITQRGNKRLSSLPRELHIA